MQRTLLVPVSALLLTTAAAPGCKSEPAAPAAAVAAVQAEAGSNGGANAGSKPGSNTKVTGDEARAAVAAGALLVDVRSPEEFAGGHIDGARNIPIDSLTGRMAEIPKDKPVVVYCAVGGRSAQAAVALSGAGYTVKNLGAMSNWGP